VIQMSLTRIGFHTKRNPTYPNIRSPTSLESEDDLSESCLVPLRLIWWDAKISEAKSRRILFVIFVIDIALSISGFIEKARGNAFICSMKASSTFDTKCLSVPSVLR